MKAEWSGFGIVDGRGKLGGHVATKAKGGATIRTKVSPANPQTAAQQNARNRLGTNSQAWRDLSESDRQSWISAAPNFPQVKNGRTFLLSGSMLYNMFNNNLLFIGQSPISVAPLPEAIPDLAITGLASDVSSSTFTITSDDATVPMGFSLVILAIAPTSPGRYNLSNRFRFIGLATLAMNTDNMFTEYTAKFGSLVAGQKVAVRGYLISETTGQAGVPSEVTAIITA